MTTSNSSTQSKQPTPKRPSAPNKTASPLSAAALTHWLAVGSKLLLSPDTYSKRNLTTQWARTKRVAGLAKTIRKGVGYAWHVDQTPGMPQSQIIDYIQKFCRTALQAVEIEVIALEPIPQPSTYQTNDATDKPSPTGVLWASNHISWVDIPVIGSIIPTFFLSKAEIGKWPVIGWLATTANTLFISRGSGDAANVTKEMEKFLGAGYPVVFFPEATTSDGRQIRRIYGKLLQAAMDTQAPIQPMVICYVDDQGNFDDAIPYYGDMNMLQSVKRVLDNRPAKAYVLPLEPILPGDQTRSQLTDLLQKRMSEGLQRLQQQVVKQQPS